MGINRDVLCFFNELSQEGRLTSCVPNSEPPAALRPPVSNDPTGEGESNDEVREFEAAKCRSSVLQSCEDESAANGFMP